MPSTSKNRPGTKLKLNIGSALRTTTEDSPPASGAPKLKIKFGGGGGGSASASASAAPSAAPTPTIKIAPPKPKNARKPSAAKASKASVPASAVPSAPSKKRAQPIDEENHHKKPIDAAQPQIKRLKLTNKAPTPQVIHTRLKGKLPDHELGVGYDSESSDRERDPAIEEEFMLRMAPGEDCDYLRRAVQEKKLGLSRREGGADVTMKFLHRNGRRAIITIRGKHYAATMVDLPGIVEGMKSWDRRGWWKSADISQMLLVLGPVANEEEALKMPLAPAIDPKTYQYPHGLTPSLHHARRRRFRKRVSTKTIEAVEDEVERLLAEDASCERGGSKYEMIDLGHLTRENSVAQPHEGSDPLGAASMQESAANAYDVDAEGEVDEGGYYDYDDGEAGLEADLEQAMMAADEDVIASTPAAVAVETPVASATVVGAGDVTSPGAPTPPGAGDGDESSDASGDDEDDAAAAAAEAEAEAEQVVDEDTLERQRELQRQKEEIADLEQAIKNETAKLDKVFNVHLRHKLNVKIRSLQTELHLKRGTTGEEEEEL